MDKLFRPKAEQQTNDQLSRILLKGEALPLNKDALSVLVPERVKELVKNPDNLVVEQLRNEKAEVAMLVYEKDYPNTLTDPNAYAEWMKAIKIATDRQEGKSMKIMPKAPHGVNRLHEKFRYLLEQGRLSLKDRVLMASVFRVYPYNKQALFIGDFDGEAHQGIGQDFYKNTLPKFAKSLGMRFIVGENRMGNYTFFTNTLERCTVHDLKPEYKNLFPEKENDFFTIQFLYSEDKKKYVKSK